MNWWFCLILVLASVGGLITLYVIYLSHHQKHHLLTAPIVGLSGITETEIDPTGLVLVGNEIWYAQSAYPILSGTRVQVVAVKGVWLQVEPLEKPV